MLMVQSEQVDLDPAAAQQSGVIAANLCVEGSCQNGGL